MRWIFLSLGLAISAAAAFAQEQENKLIDRLLRPDTSLSNSAQNKKFNAVDGTPVDKKFVAKSSYSGDQAMTKSFSGGKNFSSKKFRAKKPSWGEVAGYFCGATVIPSARRQFATKRRSTVRTAPEGSKVVRVRDYPDNRPFLAKGTRQKALSQLDKPLTIEEVRELLNKNK